ncbi:MAG: glycosyltransferase family 2 protein [Acidimicrobiales bacterium]
MPTPDIFGRLGSSQSVGTSKSLDLSKRVGAVVVNYNAGDVLARCLGSLQQNGITDIVVVDNGSTDGSTSVVQALEVPARLIRSPRNLGYGAGANLGARSSDRELIFICNPDLVVEPGAIKCLAETLDARPDAALAGPMLLETDGSVYPSGRSFPGLGDALGHGFIGLFWRDNPWTRRYRLLGDDQHRARDADWVSGAGFLVRRDAFEAVGGFDEAYFMYVEDVDLCWRLHRVGWGVVYEPSARVVHEQGRSTSRHPYRMLAAHHRSILRFAARSTSGRERLLLPLVAVALGARLALASSRCFVAARLDRRSGAKSAHSGQLADMGNPPGRRRKDADAGRG